MTILATTTNHGNSLLGLNNEAQFGDTKYYSATSWENWPKEFRTISDEFWAKVTPTKIGVGKVTNGVTIILMA